MLMTKAAITSKLSAGIHKAEKRSVDYTIVWSCGKVFTIKLVSQGKLDTSSKIKPTTKPIDDVFLLIEVELYNWRVTN